jgi:hypothetical protein
MEESRQMCSVVVLVWVDGIRYWEALARPERALILCICSLKTQRQQLERTEEQI